VIQAATRRRKADGWKLRAVAAILANLSASALIA
jgi:hypothetical protein